MAANTEKLHRTNFLILIMAASTMAVLGLSAWFQFETALKEQKHLLAEMANNQSGLIDAVARFDAINSQDAHQDGAWAATMSQVLESQRHKANTKINHSLDDGDDVSFQFDLTRRDRDGIRYLIRNGKRAEDAVLIPLEAAWTKPFRLAVDGATGIYEGPGQNGLSVIAAYAPVDTYGWGVVVHVPVDVIRAPFVKSGIISAFAALAIILIGSLLIQEITATLIKNLNRTASSLAEAQRIARLGNWEWDLRSGGITWSDGIFRIFGLRPQQFTPSYDAFLERIHPEDREKVETAIATSLETIEPYSVKHRAIRPDGEERIVLEQGEVMLDASGQPERMSGVLLDITERKKSEEASQRLGRILENSWNEIYIFDAETYRFHQVNHGALNNLGYSIEEMSELTTYDIKPQFNRETFIKAIHPLLDGTKEFLTFEATHMRKDGTTYPVEVRLQLLREEKPPVFVAIINDITKRKQAERDIQALNEQLEKRVTERTEDLAQALHEIEVTQGEVLEREERLRSILDTVVDGIIASDQDGIIQSFNPAAERIFGYPASEVIGKNIKILMQEKDSVRHDGYVGNYKNTGRKKILGIGREAEGMRKDGSVFPMDLAVNVVRLNGRMLFTGIVRDITERREAESQINIAREQAEQANQAKSEFLSSMSHELRTPLNAILGFAQLMQFADDEPMSENRKESVGQILKAGQHLLELINEVLDLAKIEAGKISLSIENVALSNVTQECFSLAEPLAEDRGITLRGCNQADAATMVRADYTRLKQVLMNLLSNAVKYNKDKGCVSFACERTINGRVRLSVEDTGPGIPEKRLGELFQPFNRLEAEGTEVEGTGIGLTTTRRLVEAMGGMIGVESVIGQGTVFWIELPEAVSDERPEVAAQVDQITKQPRDLIGEDKKWTALYVEDNPANLTLVQKIIGQLPNAELLSAHTAPLGLDLARTHKPDVIVLDINLPGMDGFEVLRRLQGYEETRNTPVVALSANAMPRDIKRGREAGFFEYLTKPLNVDSFLAAIEAALKSGSGAGDVDNASERELEHAAG